MAWDRNRKAPIRRLVREWIVYIVIIAVIFGIFFQDSVNAGTFLGLALSGPLYVGFGAIMAKFGYERQRLIRARPTPPPSTAQRSRTKPAPTSRTGGGKGRKKR